MKRISDSVYSVIKKLIPASMKKRIKDSIAEAAKSQMVYGYNALGKNRPLTRISNTVIMWHPEKIDIEDNIFISHYTILDGTGGLKIKEGSQIGAWVGIFTHSSHISIRLLGRNYMKMSEYNKPGYVIEPVEIGKYVIIGAGSVILPGVKVGDHSIISAGSVVHKDVPSFSVVLGSPARVIANTIDLDLKEYEKINSNTEWFPYIDKTYIEQIKAIKENKSI
jgi:acetyltransferase-like isoleucine patch superfamily enzyme